jgi:hypothetical protein
MKITRKHIFIISGIIGIIGLIALVVVIIIKVSNTSKTCDTSGGKKLYCNDTVCIDCGDKKTYDCDKGMCVVTCDTSGGKKLYCNGEQCIDCGLNKTYDCIGGKKCICDTGFKECGDNCCPNEKTCIKPDGTQSTSCCSVEQQCGKNESGDYTQCCGDTDFCINPSDGGSTSCCDGGREPCGYDDNTKLYTTCCKGEQKCNTDSICELKCEDGMAACGEDTCCPSDTCIKPDDSNDPYCCYGVRCGLNSSGDYTICCQGKDAVCGDSNKCEVTCTSPEIPQCNDTICGAQCSNKQTYDCMDKKCICNTDNPIDCKDGTCCTAGQSCYVKVGKSISECCNTDQLCGTQCCDPNSMCKDGTCVLRCALDDQFLDCRATDAVCIKGINLSDTVKNDLITSAKTDPNILNNKVICNGSNDCAYCINKAPGNFSSQEWRYPLKVGSLSVGSYIIGDLGGGGSSNSGYCTHVSQDDTDGDKHSYCNTHINQLDCINDTAYNCFWNNFLPQDPTTDLGKFYGNLNTQFTNDENVINKYNKQDKSNNYYGVWENNPEDGISHYVNIKTNSLDKNMSISDCIAINNNIEGVSNITYLDNTKNQLCLSGFYFTSVDKETCSNGINTVDGVICNTNNGNITYDTSCNTSCGSTNYTTEKWYNQPRNKIWSCNNLNVDQNMLPEDTITAYCPDYTCNIKEWMIQDTNGNCGGDERTWDVNDSTLTYIGVQPITFLNLYFVTINIINKTQKNMACYCETKNYPNAQVYAGRYFIEANSSKKIGVKGAQIAYDSGKAPFYIYTCKDLSTFKDGIKNIANFEIFYDSGCSLNNYSRTYSITNTLNIKDSKRDASASKSIYCGVDIVFYPDSFHTELPFVGMHGTVDLINKIKDIYRLKDQ